MDVIYFIIFSSANYILFNTRIPMSRCNYAINLRHFFIKLYKIQFNSTLSNYICPYKEKIFVKITILHSKLYNTV